MVMKKSVTTRKKSPETRSVEAEIVPTVTDSKVEL